MILFHGSSFLRNAVSVQSKDEKRPPQTPNCPPRTGARDFTANTAPCQRDPQPDGAFLAPLIECHIP